MIWKRPTPPRQRVRIRIQSCRFDSTEWIAMFEELERRLGDARPDADLDIEFYGSDFIAKEPASEEAGPPITPR